MIIDTPPKSGRTRLERSVLRWTIATTVLALSSGDPARAQQGGSRPAPDWREDWAVEDGFSLAVDATGFDFPSAIAFVPRPGPRPEDPLYFVTELRGRIKVVSNDRRVHTFVEGLVTRRPDAELPAERGETGLAGICLDPERGYVFATFAYRDSAGTMRNSLTRFETTPGTFALTPTKRRDFFELFAGSRSTQSHQIGACQVRAGLLYVSVGDGMQQYESHNLNSVLGKVLRLTVEGRPAPANPFLVDDDPTKPRNLVWASGFRNPFGLKLVGDRLFSAENGPAVDRFEEVQRGRDYQWDGSDWSMGLNALWVMTPSPGPVQVEYYAGGASFLPARWRHHFFLATSGLPQTAGTGSHRGAKGIVAVPYDTATGRLAAVPSTFMQFRGQGYQSVVGVALGPDGLYIVPILPMSDGQSAVLKLAYDPTHAHPHLLSGVRDPWLLFAQQDCLGCHSWRDRRQNRVGPPLDADSLLTTLGRRLNSPGYAQLVASLDARPDADSTFRAARHAVLAATGKDRIRTWIRHRLYDPRFDDPGALMPAFHLSRGQGEMLADYLLTPPEPEPVGWKARVARFLPAPGYRNMLLLFAVGTLLGWVGRWVWGRR